jgi:hypothetical protein
MYSKLVPVVSAACLIAPAIRAREGSTPAVAVALKVSTAISGAPLLAKRPPGHIGTTSGAQAAYNLRRLWLMAG